MQFQALLLPAILFAQSSVAYNCCFQVGVKGARGGYHKIFGSGPTENWVLASDCTVAVFKPGNDCSRWYARATAGTSCSGLGNWEGKSVPGNSCT
ncbi:hypothetical protein Vi05172_g9023 [Venturia inaequalis]|nr:hypothetical protein Vi05172_g9023 [Venturia inaequalis]